MLDTFQSLLANQFEASFCMLCACLDRCPESSWNAPVANHKFCQAAFHTLFYADFYLSPSENDFRTQPFHLEHAEFFRDYEEFESRPPIHLYDRPAIKTYLDHCRAKAKAIVPAETAESLTAKAAFTRRDISRAELHVYNIRHIQHHIAQLSLRLRLDHQIDIPWVGSGWRE